MKAPDRFQIIKTSALSLIAITTFILMLLVSTVALAQNAGVAGRVSMKLDDSKATVETKTPAKTAQAPSVRNGLFANGIQAPSPNTVTVTSYPFTSSTGISLEDMSSGTTQLVTAS